MCYELLIVLPWHLTCYVRHFRFWYRAHFCNVLNQCLLYVLLIDEYPVLLFFKHIKFWKNTVKLLQSNSLLETKILFVAARRCFWETGKLLWSFTLRKIVKFYCNKDWKFLWSFTLRKIVKFHCNKDLLLYRSYCLTEGSSLEVGLYNK